MKYSFSAGGVVYKKEQGKTVILVAQHSAHHGWVFPKGLIGDHVEGESKEETAVREVQEETGVLGKIVSPLHPVQFYFVWEGEKVKKTVYYYIMEYVSGDITKHDWEMEKVEWLNPEEVAGRLTYKGDKTVWREAKSTLLKQNSNIEARNSKQIQNDNGKKAV